jgi:hypothetical protein
LIRKFYVSTLKKEEIISAARHSFFLCSKYRRANAMLMMKGTKFSEESGIGALSALDLGRHSSDSLTE